MKLKYWTGFSKRKNSTLQPNDSLSTEIDVVLKEDTSIDNPSVILTGNTVNIDYCYIADFGKYYFVEAPIILTNGLTQYDLTEDYLATHKTAVGNTVAHIAYSTTGWDAYIPDPRMAVKPTFTYFNRQTASSGLSNIGVYILSVINGQSNGDTGCITYYYIPYNYLDNLMNDLLDSTIWSQVKAMLDNPLDSVVNLIWVPIPYGSLNIESSMVNIQLMNATLPNTFGFKVTNPIAVLAVASMQIPYRSQDFRDSQPYTSLSLYLPGLGLSDLNANDFIESANVSVYTYIDFTHGDLTYWIYNDDGVVVKTCMFHCGVTVPIAHISSNAGGGIASIGGTVGGIATMAVGLATGNIPMAMGGAGAGALASANAALQFNTRSTSLHGSDVGRSAFENTTFALVQSVVDTEDCDATNYKARIGRPVGKTQAISNHSGYVQCEAASVNIAGDNNERDIINNYLNTGFYYE